MQQWLVEVTRGADVTGAIAKEVAIRIKPLFDIMYESISVPITVPPGAADHFNSQFNLFSVEMEKRNKSILLERIYREVESIRIDRH